MLVSIIVITYNSSKYVLETLESAYRQTYNDIELIVSDDCSTDNTFELCQQWVEEHKERFIRTLCTQTPHNGGVVWNCNHALSQASGEWIKYTAGDDLLFPNCIERFIHNIQPSIFLYTCSIDTFDDINGSINIDKSEIIKTTAKKQIRDALKTIRLTPGASLFFQRDKLIEMGGFDMRYPMLEDFPITYKYLTNKLQIGIIDEVLVRWRILSNSISHSNPTISNSFRQCKKYYTQHYCWRYGLFIHQYYHWVLIWIEEHYSKGLFYKAIGYMLQCTNMVHIYRKLRSKLSITNVF